MIIRRRMMENDGREAWTLETWLSERDKPISLRFLCAAIELGVDPFRECVSGIKSDGDTGGVRPLSSHWRESVSIL